MRYGISLLIFPNFFCFIFPKWEEEERKTLLGGRHKDKHSSPLVEFWKPFATQQAPDEVDFYTQSPPIPPLSSVEVDTSPFLILLKVEKGLRGWRTKEAAILILNHPEPPGPRQQRLVNASQSSHF